VRELKFKKREDWLAKRREIISATDMPAILGVSPYAGALAIYESKVSGSNVVEETERMRFGRRLQQPVMEEYTERTGRPANDHGMDISLHPTYGYIGATLDGDQKDPKLGQGVLEIKTTDWLEEDEEPPLHWQVQLQHQMMVTRMRWGTIACLVRGNHLVWWDLEADNDLHQKMEATCHEFWQKVRQRNPPAADGSDASADAIRALYRKEDPGKTLALELQHLELVAAWELAKKEASAAQKAAKALQQEVQLILGDAEIGLLPDGTKLSWKTQDRKGYVVEDSSMRVLRHLKGRSK
jgi:putative phage-type endonuclease